MSTSTNYQGRKVDLCIFPDLLLENVPADARFSENPKVTAGLLMAAQNFVRILLTKLGHYRQDPDHGSNLLSKLTTSRVRFPSDVLHAFSIESARVIAYMRLTNREDQPADERIKSASLVSQEVTGTTIYLTIEVESESEEKVSFLLPVNWTI